MPKTAKDCPLDLCTSCAGWLLHTETAYMLYYAQGVSLLSYEQKISSLADLVRHAGRVVFFGGAGVSTESGIPDFRSAQGLYHQKRLVPAEEVLSIGYYRQHPDAFYQFYRENLLCLDALPNAAHRTLARWEHMGKLTDIVTQNIDGLHQLAGSRRVWELHGSVHRNLCGRCSKVYDARFVAACEGSPKCACGGSVKPDVVLYGESLDPDVIEGAIDAISRSDLLIVGGTSLQVYPAAGFVQGYRGNLVIINKSPTPMDHQADLVIDQPIGQSLEQADALLTSE